MAEAHACGAVIEELFISPAQLHSAFALELTEKLRAEGVQVYEVSEAVFASLAARENPQGIAAVVRQRWSDPASIQVNSGGPWVGLENAADPGNIGTILRTADGAGAAGMLLIGRCADPYDPSALRAAMGATFALPLIKATLAEAAEWAKENDLAVVGASDKGDDDFQNFAYPRKMLLLLGSEREGLSAEAVKLASHLVAIPMRGRSDSLNLAAAAAVILYQILGQRRNSI